MSTQETHGVPDSLDFKEGAGTLGSRLYECSVCGTKIEGTENAQNHTQCNLPPECPSCGQRSQGRVDVSTGLGRVDYCPRCSLAFTNEV